MLGYYLRLLFSPTAYQAWLATNPTGAPDMAGALSKLYERAKNPIKASLMGLGAMLMAGQIDLGPKGYWVAPLLMAAQGFIQKNPTIDTVMANAPPAAQRKAETLGLLAPVVPAPVQQPLVPGPGK